MAKTNDQPIVGAYGDVYTAIVGTPIPTVLDTPGVAWTKLGMVSEDGCSWTPPEEETEEIKIWQSPFPKRVVTTGMTSSLNFALDDWDRESIPFAMGGGTFADVGANVVFSPPSPGSAAERALYVYVKDGTIKMGIYFGKGRVTGRDDSVFKPDEAALLNVEFSLLVEEGKDPYNLLFETATFPSGIVATGATQVSGTAGNWTPAGAAARANLAAMTGITATPATAWASGSHMVLADATKAYWNATTWIVGQAP